MEVLRLDGVHVAGIAWIRQQVPGISEVGGWRGRGVVASATFFGMWLHKLRSTQCNLAQYRRDADPQTLKVTEINYTNKFGWNVEECWNGDSAGKGLHLWQLIWLGGCARTRTSSCQCIMEQICNCLLILMSSINYSILEAIWNHSSFGK
jgi:hypothetical protein